MTSEYGAASQLEKIDMLDFAAVIVVNKFDKRGAEDALRDVRKQWKRNRVAFEATDDEIPVFSTIASQFNDPGVNRVFLALCAQLAERAGDDASAWEAPTDLDVRESKSRRDDPGRAHGYLAEIAAEGRGIGTGVEALAAQADLAQHLYESLRALGDEELPAPLEPAAATATEPLLDALRSRYNDALDALGGEPLALLRAWPKRRDSPSPPRPTATTCGDARSPVRTTATRSATAGAEVAAPRLTGWGELLRFLMNENLPGAYPYTAGVFPYRREGEDPTRMFAGEGTPERTNRRFHYLAAGQPAARLSTAFDSVTLYGEDPAGARTSTARSATRASRSRRSTT